MAQKQMTPRDDAKRPETPIGPFDVAKGFFGLLYAGTVGIFLFWFAPCALIGGFGEHPWFDRAASAAGPAIGVWLVLTGTGLVIAVLCGIVSEVRKP